jgi:hypothetical protein
MGRALLVAAMLGCSALAASACFIFERGKSFEIPPEWATSDASYTVLYSTLGYDSAATTRVLVRQNDVEMEPAVGLSFYWRLVDDGNDVKADGFAQYAGTAYGIPLWVADFSDFDGEGTFRLALQAPESQLATPPFEIANFVLSRDTFVPLALENAEARAAPLEMDGGFFDSHTQEGSASAHAQVLLGLLAVFESRRSSLTEDMRSRLKEAIDIATDYLLLLSDPATGEIAHTAPTRPYQGFDPDDTVEGARALARYSVVFQREEPARADRAYRRARLADEWVVGEQPAVDYPAWTQAAVALDFYRYSLDLTDLNRAVEAVRGFAVDYDIREMERFGSDTSPHFETMFALWQNLPEHSDRAIWEETAQRVAAQYQEMIDRNVFGVILPAVEDNAIGASAAEQWDTVEDEPPPGEGGGALVGNEWIIARAMDAAYLADITDDPELEQVATASLLWATGLNPGLPADRTSVVAGASPVEAASFVTGTDVAQALLSPDWMWRREHNIGAIAGGFRGGFAFDGELDTAGTSIARDGLWLNAVVVYETYLHRGTRPETPVDVADPESDLFVGAIVQDDDGERMLVLITVVDSERTPVEGVLVTGVWSGERDADQPLEDTLAPGECVTDAGGSCSIEIASGDLSLPVTFEVTNLESPGALFVPGGQTLPEPVVFD